MTKSIWLALAGRARGRGALWFSSAQVRRSGRGSPCSRVRVDQHWGTDQAIYGIEGALIINRNGRSESSETMLAVVQTWFFPWLTAAHKHHFLVPWIGDFGAALLQIPSWFLRCAVNKHGWSARSPLTFVPAN